MMTIIDEIIVQVVISHTQSRNFLRTHSTRHTTATPQFLHLKSASITKANCVLLRGLGWTVAVRLSTQFQLPGQSGRCVVSGNDEFDQLNLLGLVERLIFEKSIQLGLGLDHIRNCRIFVLSERVQDLGVIPIGPTVSEKRVVHRTVRLTMTQRRCISCACP